MPKITPQDYKYKTQPYAHQRVVFELSRDMKHFALLMDMGTGKTKVVIDTACWLWSRGEIQAMLVIAPNGVHAVWDTTEIPIHMPDYCPVTSRVYNSKGNTKKYKNYMKSLGEDNENLKILCINIEALATKKGMAYANRLVDLYKTMVVVDESTRIKSWKAKRTKNAIILGAKSSYTRILTGMPITQNPLDLYTQFEFLNPYILDHSSFFSFKARYARVQKRKAQKKIKGRMKYWTYEDIVEFRHLDELTAKINPVSFRVTKEECLDLPPKIYEEIKVPLAAEQMRVYKELQNELKFELESGELITAPMALTRMMRLQQIIGGFVNDEFGESHDISGGCSKLDYLIYSLEDVPPETSVIIWARFRKEIKAITERIRRTFGNDSCGSYYGDTSITDRAGLIRDFQSGKVQFFVGNAQAAGHGLTLTKASLVYYFSNDFSLENRMQSEDRAHRIGQHSPVVYKDLVAVKSTGGRTIDGHVLSTLKDKKDIAAIVTDGLESYKTLLE